MKADFVIALHFHQPVGNFDHVIERACDKCYVPFLSTLKKYPKIKVSLHFTGCLLEWFEEKRPEIIKMIQDLASSGQAEIISGGFYEPIIPAIPPKDALRQIEILTSYIKDKFHQEAKGAWIAERVWEPHLPSILSDAGVKYVILDDEHFLYSGIAKDKTYGFYITEDNAKEVAVFPSDKTLRYHIPYKMPADCTGYMKSVAERIENPLFIYGDDGEKFGEWPGTHKWVYEEKWLENFFTEIMQSSSWLNTVTLSDCFKNRAPEGRVYLAASSYEEMLEWALPASVQENLEDVKKDIQLSGKEEFYRIFIRGGFWRNFLVKYPEANHMHKKMIYLSKRLESLRLEKKAAKKDIEKAEREVLRAQCNCAYWHGVFGGLYLFHLRRAIYHHLVKAEEIMDKARQGEKDFLTLDVSNVDSDGFSQVVMENKELAMHFSPAKGGALEELDAKKVSHNLMNSLTRRKEAYHRKILKKIEEASHQANGEKARTIHDDIQKVDASLKNHLKYDEYERNSLIDHFLKEDVTIEDFSGGNCKEEGDFTGKAYAFETKESPNKLTLTMKREGKVSGKKISLIKEVVLPKKGPSFSVKYTVTNRETGPVNLLFGSEFNITMPEADSSRYFLSFDDKEKAGSLKDILKGEDVKKAAARDSGKEISLELTLSEKCRIWHFPVKTVSQSESAYDLNYQSSVIFPHFKIKLDKNEEKTFTLDVKLLYSI